MQHWFSWCYFVLSYLSYGPHPFSIHCIVPNQIMWLTEELNWDEAAYLSKSTSVLLPDPIIYVEKTSIIDILVYSSERFKALPPLGMLGSFLD